MKGKYILAGCLALYLKVKAQNADTVFLQRNIPRTEIDAIFSYYGQDGSHSAVTGGTGTEKLNVYAASFSVISTFKNFNKMGFDAGTDIISSASTDNIDFVVSSASKRDARTFANINYQRYFKKSNISIGGGTGMSIESDYFSVPVSLIFSYTNPSAMRSLDLNLQAFFDDLRWGRLNPDYYRPVKLIYPYELRGIEWFDRYRRYTFSARLSITQIVNERLILGFFPGIIYQEGLLSTPFHRVYFTDNSLKVENLPDNRLKFLMGINANYFIFSKIILKAGYGFYRDSFRIIANTLDLEASYKATPLLIVNPFARLYTQTASEYFRPYGMHLPGSEFYTSDYDLSKLQTLKLGIGFKIKPNIFLSKKLYFREINLRYAYYLRNDALKAHIASLLFSLETPSGVNK